jgi:arabinan endo-1,5-alpha-L-arabinosidase
MNYGRIARVVVPAAAAVAGAAVVATVVANDVEAEQAPEPAPLPDTGATAGAEQIGSTPAPAPAPATPVEPEPAPAPAPEPTPEASPEPVAPARRTYTNPVFAENAPDPAIVRGDDGMFYAFTTESAFLPFQVLKSADLTSWERVGGAFEGTGPSWIKEHRWAPDVQKTGDHYTMTYSGRGHDGQMKIGYATSATAQGPYQDRGILLEGDSGGYYIDSHLEQVGDDWVLYYGSTGGTAARDQTGIEVVGVDMAADGSMKTRGQGGVILSEAGERELVEGAWVHERDGQFYMFYSDGKWDAKGGADDYALKVARGPSPIGPFEKLGTPLLQQGNGYTGTGHNSIITDDAGQDWVLYHAWGADPSKGRVLMLDPIEWRDGWPVVNQGAGPSTTALDAPVVAAREGATAVSG